MFMIMWKLNMLEASLYNLASIDHLTICVTYFSNNSLQIVCIYGSEFRCRWAHSPIMFVLIDHKFSMETGVHCFQASFCLYTMVINEIPGALTWSLEFPLTNCEEKQE